jgi:hypothetical protein
VVKNTKDFHSLTNLYKARAQNTATFHNHLPTFLQNNCSHRQYAISYFKGYQYTQDNFYINFEVNQSKTLNNNLIQSSSFFGNWCKYTATTGSVRKTFP